MITSNDILSEFCESFNLLLTKLCSLFEEPEVDIPKEGAVQEQKEKPANWIEREVDVTQSMVTLDEYINLRHH